jgi:uroporphyrinogen decarboxylase
MLAGRETLLLHLEHYPDALLIGLNTLAEATKRLIIALERVGADGIYYAAQHLADAVIPRQLYQRFGLNIDQQIMQLCQQFTFNILHIHGAGIHFDCLPTASNWMVHFELGDDNPTPEEYREHCRCPAVIALPCSFWSRTESLIIEINQLLQRFSQHSALITAQCVVPLNTPNEQIASWITRIRHA